MTEKKTTKKKRRRAPQVAEMGFDAPSPMDVIGAAVAAAAPLLLDRLLGPRVPPVSLNPDVFQYRTCASCADCPACGLPRRAHDSDPVAARTHTRNS